MIGKKKYQKINNSNLLNNISNYEQELQNYFYELLDLLGKHFDFNEEFTYKKIIQSIEWFIYFDGKQNGSFSLTRNGNKLKIYQLNYLELSQGLIELIKWAEQLHCEILLPSCREIELFAMNQLFAVLFNKKIPQR